MKPIYSTLLSDVFILVLGVVIGFGLGAHFAPKPAPRFPGQLTCIPEVRDGRGPGEYFLCYVAQDDGE